MPSGFVNRWKGKIAADQIWIGGQSLVGPASGQTLSTGSATNIIAASGVTSIAATSVLAIFRLQKPTVTNTEKTIQLTTVSSGIFITASTDGSVTLNGSSINTTIKSTLAGVIALVATSTSNWAIVGVYPSTTGFPTLSTST